MLDGGEPSGGTSRPQMGEISTQADVYHADMYRAPKLPRFFREDPGSFFVIAEASFRRAHIRSESIKADYLIASLDQDLVPHIKHIIEAEPKPADVYTQIKNRLIASFSISAETRFRRLLRGEVILDGKPSLLLTRLGTLNDGSCSDTILKSVFLEQMPSHIRAILAMSNVEDLQELANLADKVSEASQPTNYQIASTSNIPDYTTKVSAVSTPVDPISALTEILTRQFERLSSEIRELKSSQQTRSRSTSRHRLGRDRSRNRNSNKRCYYHQRFGTKANKCVQPCSWKNTSNSGNQSGLSERRPST